MSAFYASNLVLVQATLVAILLALSIQVPLRLGVFSLAGVGSYGIGAYVSANLVLRAETGALPTMLVSGLVAAAVGLVLGVIIYRLAGLYLAMATIAFDLTVGVVALNGGDWTGGPVGLFGVFTNLTMGLLFGTVVLVLVLVHLTEVGRLSRRITTVREDPELAASMGVNVRAYRLTVFVVSGFLGGLAGCLNTLTRSAVGLQDVSFHLVVVGLTTVIVGGALSWRGAVIGAALFTWLPSVLEVVGEWQEFVYGLIVVLAAIFLPTGLYGLWCSVRRWLVDRMRPRPRPRPGSEPRPEAPSAAAAAEQEVAAR